MLLDIRTYTCRPGTLNEHLALYAKIGFAPQSRCLGAPVAYAAVETPNPNQYVHIWAYKDSADREVKRAAMWSDAEWLAYTVESKNLNALIKQENMLVKTVDFVPEPQPANA